MATTIPGGAYLAPDGTSWVDAEGKPLTKAQIADAEDNAQERAVTRATQEALALELEARNNPTAQAIAAALRPAPAAPKGAKPKAEE